jgi:hypothetical protein
MDYRNRAIFNPNACKVNTAMQRRSAKAISVHGIGLYIFEGEDLPIGLSYRSLTTKRVSIIECDVTIISINSANMSSSDNDKVCYKNVTNLGNAPSQY